MSGAQCTHSKPRQMVGAHGEDFIMCPDCGTMFVQPTDAHTAAIARLTEELEGERALANGRQGRIDDLEHDLDAMRTRLVDEHEGHSARVDADVWEKQCAEAQGECNYLRDERDSLRSRVAGLEAALQTAIGHSNCYCKTCTDLSHAHWSPSKGATALGKDGQ